jgi:PPOX class probable F420-dependent enzyme
MRRLVLEARSAALATHGPGGSIHVVPVCFAIAGDTVYSAVDEKPKRSTALQRLRNVRANPAVALLVDGYDEDWARLWWVRLTGRGRVLAAGDTAAGAGHGLLRAKYPQYAEHALGEVLAIDVDAWYGWSASAMADTTPA